MEPARTDQEIELHFVTPQNLTELMNSLQRIFNTGLYYPSGHDVVDLAMGSFLHSLRKILGDNNSFLHFAVTETTLTLQDIELDIQLPSVKTFHKLLHALSITALDIHRDITTNEALLFVRKLISFRARIQNCRNFSELEIIGLPATVKIHQLQFLSTKSTATGDGSGDASQPTIDYLLSSLAEHGIQQEQLSICRRLLQSIPAALEKRQPAESNLPSVTWGDVEKLLFGLAETIESSSQNTATSPPLEKQHNIDPLIAILKSLEGTEEATQAREAIDLLIHLTRDSLPQLEQYHSDASIGLRLGDRTGISIKQLKEDLLFQAKHSLPTHLFANDRGEQLSILMLILGRNPPLQVMMRIQEVLRDCLSTALEPREWKIVTGGMSQLVKNLNDDRLHFVFIMFIDFFRRSRYTSSLIFLRDVCQSLTVTEFATCWPFLINELFIQGSQTEPELFRELSAISGRLPHHYMRKKLPYLKRLDALSEKKIVSIFFSPPPPELYPLLVLLLKSSQAAYICEKLIKGLKEQAICWLDKGVIPLLDSRSLSDQRFLLELLRQKNPSNPVQGLKKKGVEIIIERLPEITVEQRKDEWVVDSIAALSHIRLRTARNLLENIIQSRRYLIIPLWPGPARAAARKALSNY